MSLEYLIGVDLGQAHDYTALTVLERHTRPVGEGKWRGRKFIPPKEESTYQARHLERFELGTPYPQQVERVKELVIATRRIRDPKTGEAARVRLVVDQTGVGRPVVDMLRAANLRDLTAVTIHGGDQTIRDGNAYRVPKRELVSVLQVLLQTKRLEVAAALPLAQTLQREMLAFKVEISKSGHDTYGNDWRENPHDDLVLSVALAAWAGEKIARPSSRRYV
ncbi:MAG TPA: hypothetical protein VF202_03080 [Trueperaceae bacterium]